MTNPQLPAPQPRRAAPPQAAPGLEETLQKALDRAFYFGGSPGAQRLRNLLNGTWH